jgi:hypothetical protein
MGYTYLKSNYLLTGTVPDLFSKSVLHFLPYIITNKTKTILTALIALNIVKRIPGPRARKQDVEKVVVTAANINRTRLLIATALADLPGFESTRYIEAGLRALI